MQAQDPFSFNPTIACRTRYGVTTNLFGAGTYYQFIGIKGGYNATVDGDKLFIQ